MKLCDNFFSLLSSPVNTVKLTQQYRMSEEIMRVSNRLVYRNQMTLGVDGLKDDPLGYDRNIAGPLFEEMEGFQADWIQAAMSSDPRKAVLFVNTAGTFAFENRLGDSYINDAEGRMVYELLKFIVQVSLPTYAHSL